MQQLRALIPGFWETTCRQLSVGTAKHLAADSKAPSGSPPVIYVPIQLLDTKAVTDLQQNCKDVEIIPLNLVGAEPDSQRRMEIVKCLSSKPGLLALATTSDGTQFRRFMVPGGRFNEMYGWDSYFIGLGLIQDNLIDLAVDLALNLCAEIQFYGMVLNANRSYYLGRSHPPLLTDLVCKLYAITKDQDLLQEALRAAIKEYNTVWMGSRLDEGTGLSKYAPPVPLEFPKEVELGHYDSCFTRETQQAYDRGDSTERARVMEFLRHDVAVRESGHDTSSRLHERCADLATVDLNSLLYKCELDIAYMIDELGLQNQYGTPEDWRAKAEKRREAMQRMWCESDGWFYDWDCVQHKNLRVHSATALYTLWAGVATPDQAKVLVPAVLGELRQPGGLVAASENDCAGHRQWDWPAGWAPHQVIAWDGLIKYGFEVEAKSLARSWAKLVCDTYGKVGKVLEKYDVVHPETADAIAAEYGNQGTAEEGFGWTNASLAIAIDKYL